MVDRTLQVENIDEFHRTLSETMVGGTSDPYDTPYGREFVHVDPTTTSCGSSPRPPSAPEG
jgi:hypothetical protein